MSKADYIKAYLHLLRLIFSAVLGFFLIIWWGLMQNESLIKTMSKEVKVSVISIVIIFVVLMAAIFNKYFKLMAKLEKEP